MNPGMGNSQTPKNERANANTTPSIPILNGTDPNCWPQPRFVLASPMFAATLAVASTKNTANTPAQYQRFIRNTSRRAWPDCWANDMSLRPSTGSTHGMRLRIKPPTSPISSASGRERAVEAASAVPREATTTLPGSVPGRTAPGATAVTIGSGACAASPYRAAVKVTSASAAPSGASMESLTAVGASQVRSLQV
jgi:hypothetical protein